MKLTIAVLPGDGIGPEVVQQAVKVLKAIEDRYDHEFVLQYADIGGVAIDNHKNPCPKSTIETCLNADAVLMGAIGDPKYSDPTLKVRPEQGLLKLRAKLELYSNIRPVKTYESLSHLSPLKPEIVKDLDFVIYRELTGGIYFGEKGLSEDGQVAYDICKYSRKEIARIAHKAFKMAGQRKGKVTLVDKANVLETSRLWRDEVNQIAKQYPEIKYEKLYVDNAAMQIILHPSQFDVLLCENLFGDILSDEASVLTGSLGLLPSASIGDKCCLFEPVHGSYPQAAGKDIANPFATIMSAAMMLQHFGLHEEVEQINLALQYCMKNSILTEDLRPTVSYSCSQLGDFMEALLLEEDINLLPLNEGNSTII